MNKLLLKSACGVAFAGGLWLLGTATAHAAETSGDDGIASGSQVAPVVTTPISVGGNAVSLLGDAEAAGGEGAGDPSATTDAGTASTSGDDSVVSGTQVAPAVTAPISVDGNAISLLGDSSAAGGSDAEATNLAPGDATTSTSGDDGIASGTQVAPVVVAPIAVEGNSLSVLGDAASTAPEGTAGDAGAPADSSTVTSGENALLGGTQVAPIVTAPTEVDGNSVEVLGDSGALSEEALLNGSVLDGGVLDGVVLDGTVLDGTVPDGMPAEDAIGVDVFDTAIIEPGAGDAEWIGLDLLGTSPEDAVIRAAALGDEGKLLDADVLTNPIEEGVIGAGGVEVVLGEASDAGLVGVGTTGTATVRSAPATFRMALAPNSTAVAVESAPATSEGTATFAPLMMRAPLALSTPLMAVELDAALDSSTGTVAEVPAQPSATPPSTGTEAVVAAQRDGFVIELDESAVTAGSGLSAAALASTGSTPMLGLAALLLATGLGTIGLRRFAAA
ncbi:hypothetical protein [Ruicaihuangia caeni]|uniref:DUF320 domain-containing protein n=1 Tax=Ruicaihuangia caeni TaxID=3042517 RepID=A0AAW6T8W4_9MICO|nr:hypothetical protein [Klugiella sp. YN-L-19]MDI2098483.1 hypothetical protein [Klugiella sp. YN-L-19]